MQKDLKGPESLADIMKSRTKSEVKKTPAYQWQDLALQIIGDLAIPNFKRSAVFKVCKENPKEFIMIALNDTKELCQTGDAWKYFFKIISERAKKES